MITLIAKGLGKAYGKRHVVRDLNVVVHSGECLGIIGPNGSGKSTVVRMLGGLQRPDTGSVELQENNITMPDVVSRTGLIAPWLHVYEEFTATELLRLQLRLHGQADDEVGIAQTLERLDMAPRAHDAVRELSSGLRQRVLLALAVLRTPAVLLMDEPSITLDAPGKQLVRAEIERHRGLGGVVILATNDDEERTWCTTSIQLVT